MYRLVMCGLHLGNCWRNIKHGSDAIGKRQEKVGHYRCRWKDTPTDERADG